MMHPCSVATASSNGSPHTTRAQRPGRSIPTRRSPPTTSCGMRSRSTRGHLEQAIETSHGKRGARAASSRLLRTWNASRAVSGAATRRRPPYCRAGGEWTRQCVRPSPLNSPRATSCNLEAPGALPGSVPCLGSQVGLYRRFPVFPARLLWASWACVRVGDRLVECTVPRRATMRTYVRAQRRADLASCCCRVRRRLFQHSGPWKLVLDRPGAETNPAWRRSLRRRRLHAVQVLVYQPRCPVTSLRTIERCPVALRPACC
jgi:hypothetical protein